MNLLNFNYYNQSIEDLLTYLHIFNKVLIIILNKFY